jgi:hypothetical protein
MTNQVTANDVDLSVSAEGLRPQARRARTKTWSQASQLAYVASEAVPTLP